MKDMKGEPRPVSVSQVTHAQVAFPGDANSVGIVFGGKILQLMDMAASIAARRHSNQRVVTVAVNLVRFFRPAQVGQVIIVNASVNRVFRASMEVGVSVQAEDTRMNTSVRVCSGYFTMVALDPDQNPVPIPDVLPQTPDQERRWIEAELRRKKFNYKEKAADFPAH